MTADPKSPFRPSLLKIERAQRHIRELQHEIQEFLATDPVKVTTFTEEREVKAPDGRLVLVPGFKWHMHFSPAPITLSPIIGDIFHNLRSALDLMAGTLARQNGESPDNVYFPFAGSEDGLDGQIVDKHFDKAGPESIRLLKELKPYKGGNLELRAIHDLNIRDKHRELIVHHIAAAGPIIDTQPEDGSLMKLVGDPNKPSEVYLVFPPDCALGGKKIIDTLHSLVETVTRVIEAFEALSAPSG